MTKKRKSKRPENKRGITIYLSDELTTRLNKLKAEKGISKTFVVSAAVTAWLDQEMSEGLNG